MHYISVHLCYYLDEDENEAIQVEDMITSYGRLSTSSKKLLVTQMLGKQLLTFYR